MIEILENLKRFLVKDMVMLNNFARFRSKGTRQWWACDSATSNHYQITMRSLSEMSLWRNVIREVVWCGCGVAQSRMRHGFAGSCRRIPRSGPGTMIGVIEGRSHPFSISFSKLPVSGVRCLAESFC